MVIKKKLIIIGNYKQYYLDDILYKDCYFKDGLLHGTFNSFDNKGKKLETINYENGKPNGVHIIYFQNNKNSKQFQINYLDGIINGLYEELYDNDKFDNIFKKKYYYKNGKKNGKCITYYNNKNNTKESECEYKDDIKNGLYKSWYEKKEDSNYDMDKNEEINYNENGFHHGSYIKYNEKNIDQVWYTEQIYQKGKLLSENNEILIKNYNNNIIFKRYYVNGVLDGMQQIWKDRNWDFIPYDPNF
jgi:antitoxin component YwqK of YwqJK toxin-antitoxin module